MTRHRVRFYNEGGDFVDFYRTEDRAREVVRSYNVKFADRHGVYASYEGEEPPPKAEDITNLSAVEVGI